MTTKLDDDGGTGARDVHAETIDGDEGCAFDDAAWTSGPGGIGSPAGSAPRSHEHHLMTRTP